MPTAPTLLSQLPTEGTLSVVWEDETYGWFPPEELTELPDPQP
jgi:hypothetical protein